MRLGLVLAVTVLLSACASGPAPVGPETPEARSGSSSAPTPATPGPGVKPEPSAVSPVDRLLADARRLREAGDFPASFARLERALRIAPQRASVYLELARSHSAAGSPGRASASAERGLLYCSADTCRELRRFIEY